MARLTPAKYDLSGCTRGCSLNPQNLPGQLGGLVHSWFEQADNDPTIHAKAKSLGAKLSLGAIGRHRGRHLARADYVPPGDPGADPTKPGGDAAHLPHMEILENLIQAGARQVQSGVVKVSAEQLLRGLELHHKMTEGSAFQEFFDAMNAVGDEMLAESLEQMPDNPDVSRGTDERAQAAQPEDGPLPLPAT